MRGSGPGSPHTPLTHLVDSCSLAFCFLSEHESSSRSLPELHGVSTPVDVRFWTLEPEQALAWVCDVTDGFTQLVSVGGLRA